MFRDVTAVSLRSQIAVVLQDSFLFSDNGDGKHSLREAGCER